MSLTEELREAVRLAIGGTSQVTRTVEGMHHAIGGPIAKVFSFPVYASIKGITSLVAAALDRVIVQLGPLLDDRTGVVEREAVIAALNGVLGDRLAETGSVLATKMSFPLRSSNSRGRLVVLVHGSSLNERCWRFGDLFERELGASVVGVRYNSGLHVSENGRELSAQLQALIDAWPVKVTELVLIGHSMGGLVIRAACHSAERENRAWRSLLRSAVFLGTPHLGAALERGGNWLETIMGLHSYSAPLSQLARVRSAGVTDLRYGLVLDEHWRGKDRFALEHEQRATLPLPSGVRCFAVASTGDGLVSVKSALALGFAETLVVEKVAHLGLLGDAQVGAQLVTWLKEQPFSAGARE